MRIRFTNPVLLSGLILALALGMSAMAAYAQGQACGRHMAGAPQENPAATPSPAAQVRCPMQSGGPAPATCPMNRGPEAAGRPMNAGPVRAMCPMQSSGPGGECCGMQANLSMALRGLNLSEEQRARIKTSMEDTRAKNEPMREEIMRLRQELHQQMLQDQRDMNAIHAVLAQIEDLRLKMETNRVETHIAIRDVLTPEQRAQIMARMTGEGGPGMAGIGRGCGCPGCACGPECTCGPMGGERGRGGAAMGPCGQQCGERCKAMMGGGPCRMGGEGCKAMMGAGSCKMGGPEGRECVCGRGEGKPRQAACGMSGRHTTRRSAQRVRSRGYAGSF